MSFPGLPQLHVAAFLGVAQDAGEQEVEGQAIPPHRGHSREQPASRLVTRSRESIKNGNRGKKKGPAKIHDGGIAHGQMQEPQQGHHRGGQQPGEQQKVESRNHASSCGASLADGAAAGEVCSRGSTGISRSTGTSTA
jgi:hypothetical protein